MKRFFIPALFVVDVADNENVSAAQKIATTMQSAANNAKFSRPLGVHTLLLDEEVPSREVPIPSGKTELPHTFKWNSENIPGHIFVDCGGIPRCKKCGCDEDDAFVANQPCIDDMPDDDMPDDDNNPICICGSRIFNDKGDCEKCGL